MMMLIEQPILAHPVPWAVSTRQIELTDSGGDQHIHRRFLFNLIVWMTWRRPTLPCLKTQYHGRWGFSRPSSGWDRVQAPRNGHQVVQPIVVPGLVWIWCVV